jgi:hypothetical protein
MCRGTERIVVLGGTTSRLAKASPAERDYQR